MGTIYYIMFKKKQVIGNGGSQVRVPIETIYYIITKVFSCENFFLLVLNNSYFENLLIQKNFIF